MGGTCTSYAGAVATSAEIGKTMISVSSGAKRKMSATSLYVSLISSLPRLFVMSARTISRSGADGCTAEAVARAGDAAGARLYKT